ncbi:MAG: DsbA family protein [Mariprofundus sp.]
MEQRVSGTHFNFAFWQQCTPRRSTYPACRAVIAARKQQAAAETAMIHAIGDAYYRQARNPSDDDVLIACAISIGLHAQQFQADLHSAETSEELQHEIAMTRELGASGFPSLILQSAAGPFTVPLDYCHADTMLDVILVQCLC